MPFVRLTRFFYQRNSAFRRKILVGFLLSSILPVLLIGSLAYSFSYKIARDSIIQSITYANIQLSNTISNRFLQGANAADILQPIFSLWSRPKASRSSASSIESARSEAIWPSSVTPISFTRLSSI
jgi:two-component system sensor histidine kinase YesM